MRKLTNEEIGKSDKIVKFLKDHPFLSLRPIEVLVYGKNCTGNLWKAVKGEFIIPPKYHEKLSEELKKYGFKK